MGALIPVLLLVLGLAAGVGAGFFLRPAPPEPPTASSVDEGPAEAAAPLKAAEPVEVELSFVKINNQFVVPVIKDDLVSALVVLSLSLEVPAVDTSAIYDREPKLRDAFLQVLFDHAYLGGFDGVYTASTAMDTLRSSLLASARRVAGENVSDVLITDIVRQDM